MPINEIDIVQTPSGQLITEIELQQGLPGPPNTLAIGSVTAGNAPSATITGSAPQQTLNLVLQRGPGRYTFSLSGGDLLAHYDDDIPPSLTINGDGDLILDLN
jgi:hypothetical protein